MAHQTYEWSLVETLWHRLILRKIILAYCLPPISWSRPGGLGASSVNGSEQWRKILQTNGKRRFNSTNEKNAKLQAFLSWTYNSVQWLPGYPALSWTNLCWKCPSTCLVLFLQPRRSQGFLSFLKAGARWTFPKIVVPPNHPFLIGFSIIFTIHFGVFSPSFGNTQMASS